MAVKNTKTDEVVKDSKEAPDKPPEDDDIVYGAFGHCIPLAECGGHRYGDVKNLIPEVEDEDE